MGLIKKLAVGTGLIVLGAGAVIAYPYVRSWYSSKIENAEEAGSFAGQIGDWKVSYREDESGNTLIARKGRTIVTYLDKEGAKPLDPFNKETPDLTDKIDSLTYQDSKGKNSFTRSTDIDSSRFDLAEITGVFESADNHYNGLRTQIRKVKRDNILNRLKEIKSEIK